MSITIFVVLLILLLLVLIIFFLLKIEIKDINEKSKLYFTRKVQEYTDQVKQPEQVKIEYKDKEEDNKITNNIDEGQSSVIYLEKKANYQIDDLLKMMKEIDNNFNLDNEKLIQLFFEEFYKTDAEAENRYNSLKEMKSYILKIGVYNIITSEDRDLIDNIEKELRMINEDIFNEYISIQSPFQIEDFLNYLNYEIGRCDPTVYIYVGEKELNYDDMNDKIKTMYSNDIYKGIKIVYLNKLYDFSLS